VVIRASAHDPWLELTVLLESELDETPELLVSLELVLELLLDELESVPVFVVVVDVLVAVSAPASVTPTMRAIVSPTLAAAMAPPATPARFSSPLGVVGSFIATTLAAGTSGEPQPTIKPVLSLHGKPFGALVGRDAR
jgi:hypothetical protein